MNYFYPTVNYVPVKYVLTWLEGQHLNEWGVTVWANSALKHTEARVVALSTAPCKMLPKEVENRVVGKPIGLNPFHRRWVAYREYLASCDPRDLVILSDARDLVFQGDPFKIAKKDTIICVGEFFATKDCVWTMDFAKDLEKKMGVQVDTSHEELNGGFFMGPAGALLELATACESGLFCGVTTDQAFLNWYLYNRATVQWEMAPKSWYIHGTACMINKLEVAIDADGYGMIAGKRATVWHQYDRVPDHNDNIYRVWMGGSAPDERLLMLVTRFNEPLTWMSKLPYKHFVVNKGAPMSATYQRPNVGFEAESAAWYFGTYYDELPELIVNLQGNPFYHIPQTDLVIDRLKWVSTKVFERFGHLPIVGNDWKHCWGKTSLDSPEHKGLPMREWWNKLFNSPPPLTWVVPWGAQFVTHRDAVRLRSKDFWLELAEGIKTKEDACTIERLWQFLLIGLP